MKIDANGVLTLSSGRAFRAIGVIGLNIQGYSPVITCGWEGVLDKYEPLSQAERNEIAEFMVAKWKELIA